MGRFAQLPAHVPAEAVAEAVERVRAAEADAIVSVGGGSVLDAAKAVIVAIRDNDGRRLRHVAVPTSLSGSEYAHFYGVTVDDFKHSYADLDAAPELVLLDPEATLATPPALWNGSAFKALDHAIETLRAPGERPIVDPLALVGIRGIAETLEASNGPGALQARMDCQIAAWRCYFAPVNAAHGLSHRIGHILGGTYGVPHAATSSVTLPAVVRAGERLWPQLDATIADALSAADPSAGHGSPADMLTALAGRLGLPTRLRDVDVPAAEIPSIVALLLEAYPSSVKQLGLDQAGLTLLLSSIE
jgi:alcohol dehydrogenase class IV